MKHQTVKFWRATAHLHLSTLSSRAQQLPLHGRQPQDRAAAGSPPRPRGAGRNRTSLPPLFLPAVGRGPGPPQGSTARRPQRGDSALDAEG